MKVLATALLIVVVIIGIGFFWIRWHFGALGNWGLESGCYGQFNRMKHVIEDMPNVTIVDHWQHHDTTIEDFGVVLRLEDGREVHVKILENSHWMRERNKEHLKVLIQYEIGPHE